MEAFLIFSVCENPVKLLTQAYLRQLRRRVQMKRICTALGWTDEEYSTCMYEMGLTYLQEYTQQDAEAIKEIENSQIYWNWWKNQWSLRDDQFVQALEYTLKQDTLRIMYAGLHNPYALAREFDPNGKIMGESYAVMIAELTKDVAVQRV